MFSDDFVLPSKQCMKPIVVAVSQAKIISIEEGEETKLQTTDIQQIAKINLQDCLACSGCITTAETLLISKQAVPEFLEKVTNSKISVVGVSPQALSSFSQYKELSLEKGFELLNQLFASLGIKKTLISSECPGWTCYAEKTADEAMIHHMSRLQSPQQVFGVIVKNLLMKKLKMKKEDIYVAVIMPCYDKKLENYRQLESYINEQQQTVEIKDVDDVLTTIELQELFQNHFNKVINNEKKYNSFEEFIFSLAGKEFTSCQKQQFTPISYALPYLETILLYSQTQIFHLSSDQCQIIQKEGKNKDLIEYTLQTVDGKQLLHCAKIYGLRNIQNLIKNAKKQQMKYDYIEVLACPIGCLNGGGQIKNENSKGLKQREQFKNIIQLQNKECKENNSKQTQQIIEEIYALFNKYSLDLTMLIQTQFKYISKEKTASDNNNINASQQSTDW